MGGTKKEETFNFFKANPKALYEKNIEDYLKELGIKQSTYNKHRNEFISIAVTNIGSSASVLTNKNKVKREKFVFDDNRLFGF
ncbi:hypothetical protein D2A34_21775 [Clostridium chromiireducens]|uniref:Uncharacterized protein n=1 Tax=Clostridium chromiireducens TaxID=225345 RepID=A0A399IIQ6_9CLOT|nr:hypothetical protein [Clostridium chromiireducens]RII32830.1 hypothetical protein D2A34_21775 [Clostridium chromiireducens]